MKTKINTKRKQFRSTCEGFGLNFIQTEALLKKAEEMYFQGQTDMNRGSAEPEELDMVDFANNLLKSQ